MNRGVTIRQAQAQLDTLQRDIVRQMPPDQRDNSRNALLSLVRPLQEAVVSESRSCLWLLLVAVSGLMLIACVNLANAQLGRAVSRERELLRLFQKLSAIYLPRMAEIHNLNAPVLVFVMLLTFCSTLFFGIALAEAALRGSANALQENSNRSQGSRPSAPGPG